MKVTITLELRFDVLTDGSVWTLSNFHRDFWNRYLEVFDKVEIVARANYVSSPLPNSRRVDEKEKVVFIPLPFYVGPIGYLKKWNLLRAKLSQVESSAEAIILRVGSPIADILYPILKSRKHPFAVEVVGDPYDTFSPGSIKTFLRPFYRWWFCKKLRSQTSNASAVSYVTSVRLPERYKAALGAKTIFASSIELQERDFANFPKSYGKNNDIRLISVGALEDWRKGPDTALKALKALRSKGLKVSLTWIGDGKNKTYVEELAQSLNLTEHVLFRGHLPSGKEIFEALDEADIFILPTRGEGLPRAMIEAMARGLVCVGSDVGGIPELISRDLIHHPEDLTGLINILEGLITNTEMMNRMAARNWNRAREYLSPLLQKRRTSMYIELEKITDEWKKSRSLRKNI